MTAVTTEMNITNSRHATKYRKIAVSFRDAQLLPIFRFGLSTLQSTLQMSGINIDFWIPIMTMVHAHIVGRWHHLTYGKDMPYVHYRSWYRKA